MAYNLLQITKEDLKNLCFGCADCNFCIEVWVYTGFKCLWIYSNNFLVYLTNGPNPAHSIEAEIEKSGLSKSYIERDSSFKKITSYEELLNHYSDGGAWLK